MTMEPNYPAWSLIVAGFIALLLYGLREIETQEDRERLNSMRDEADDKAANQERERTSLIPE